MQCQELRSIVIGALVFDTRCGGLDNAACDLYLGKASR
jgi:hypothetical protein